MLETNDFLFIFGHENWTLIHDGNNLWFSWSSLLFCHEVGDISHGLLMAKESHGGHGGHLMGQHGIKGENIDGAQ